MRYGMPGPGPLDDPTYQPLHPPVNGVIPPVVEKWGPNSQWRWFNRFWRKGHAIVLRNPQASKYFFDSVHHRGECCISCDQDISEGYQDPWEDTCCCYGARERDDS